MREGHIFLVGFMGAGKTTVARLIADRLGRPCIDLDKEIERSAQRTVAQIFSEEGEESFRTQETFALVQISLDAPSIVACGGGVVLRPQNRAILKSLGTVVSLMVTADEAIARIGDVSTRPLLSGAGGSLAATSLLAARETLYRSIGDVVIDTVGLTSEQVADRVLIELEEVTR